MADKRFAALASDPRYRLPSKKQAQTAVDPRFKRLFTDQGFQKKAAVDRYGRKLKPDSGKKELEKRFRLEDDDEEDNEPKKGDSDAEDSQNGLLSPSKEGEKPSAETEKVPAEDESVEKQDANLEATEPTRPAPEDDKSRIPDDLSQSASFINYEDAMRLSQTEDEGPAKSTA